jgi:hypothetical protein
LFTKGSFSQSNDCSETYFYAKVISGFRNFALTVLVHKWLFSQSNDCFEAYYYARMIISQKVRNLHLL